MLLSSGAALFLLCASIDCAASVEQAEGVSLYKQQSQLYVEALADGAEEHLLQVGDKESRESRTIKDLHQDEHPGKVQAGRRAARAASKAPSGPPPRPSAPGPSAYHLSHQTKMSRKEKRATTTDAFASYSSLNKEHQRMMGEERELRGEIRLAKMEGSRKDLKPLQAAFNKCNKIKAATYWKCNRIVCAYHRKCSGKKENNRCRYDVIEHKKETLKDKIMERTNKRMEKANKKKAKELHKKSIADKEKARKREVVYKSPKAKEQRKKERKAKEHRAKVDARNEKQIKSWSKNFSGGKSGYMAGDHGELEALLQRMRDVHSPLGKLMLARDDVRKATQAAQIDAAAWRQARHDVMAEMTLKSRIDGNPCDGKKRWKCEHTHTKILKKALAQHTGDDKHDKAIRQSIRHILHARLKKRKALEKSHKQEIRWQKENPLHKTPKCKKMSEASDRKCRRVTKHAYRKCYFLLKKTIKAFKQREERRKIQRQWSGGLDKKLTRLAHKKPIKPMFKPPKHIFKQRAHRGKGMLKHIVRKLKLVRRGAKLPSVRLASEGFKLANAASRDLRRAREKRKEKAARRKANSSKLDALKRLAVHDLRQAMAPFTTTARKPRRSKAKKKLRMTASKAAKVQRMEAIAAKDLQRALLPKQKSAVKAPETVGDQVSRLKAAATQDEGSLRPNPDLWGEEHMRSLQTRVLDSNFMNSD